MWVSIFSNSAHSDEIMFVCIGVDDPDTFVDIVLMKDGRILLDVPKELSTPFWLIYWDDIEIGRWDS